MILETSGRDDKVDAPRSFKSGQLAKENSKKGGKRSADTSKRTKLLTAMQKKRVDKHGRNGKKGRSYEYGKPVLARIMEW